MKLTTTAGSSSSNKKSAERAVTAPNVQSPLLTYMRNDFDFTGATLVERRRICELMLLTSSAFPKLILSLLANPSVHSWLLSPNISFPFTMRDDNTMQQDITLFRDRDTTENDRTIAMNLATFLNSTYPKTTEISLAKKEFWKNCVTFFHRNPTIPSLNESVTEGGSTQPKMGNTTIATTQVEKNTRKRRQSSSSSHPVVETTVETKSTAEPSLPPKLVLPSTASSIIDTNAMNVSVAVKPSEQSHIHRQLWV